VEVPANIFLSDSCGLQVLVVGHLVINVAPVTVGSLEDERVTVVVEVPSETYVFVSEFEPLAIVRTMDAGNAADVGPVGQTIPSCGPGYEY
jgi:hypothetical protein